MSVIKKLGHIYQNYTDQKPLDQRQTNYLNLFNQSEIITPLYEYSFLDQRATFNPHGQIAGYKATDFRSVDDLYNIVIAVDLQLKSVEKVFEVIKTKDSKTDQILSMKMESYISFKGKRGKKYFYKRIVVDNGKSHGNLTHNCNYLIDITDSKPQNTNRVRLVLGRKDHNDFEIEELNHFKKVLSPRELEILGLIVRGFTSADIANGLGISVHTVKTQRKNMIRKLDVSNSAELVNLARDMGLF